MKVIAEFCLIPLGVGVSLSRYIAACEEVLEKYDLQVVLHANGTNLQGDWDLVMKAIRECHEAVHSLGAPRISTSLRLGTRTDRDQSLSDKVESVKSQVKSP